MYTNTKNPSNFSPMPKYTNGYLPKIVHHMLQNNIAKVEYFIKRQEDVYGPLTAKQRETMAKMYFEADHKINQA